MVSRFQRLRSLLEQSLGQIQTMCPVMLAIEVRQVTCLLELYLILLFFLLFFTFSIPPSNRDRKKDEIMDIRVYMYLMVLSEKFLCIVLFQNIQYSCLHARNSKPATALSFGSASYMSATVPESDSGI